MLRLTSPAPAVVNMPKLRGELLAAFPKLVDANELEAPHLIGAYFAVVGDAPAQAALDTVVAAHDPTPPAPTAAETAFANAVARLKAGFGTARTQAQQDQALDDLIVVVRRIVRELT